MSSEVIRNKAWAILFTLIGLTLTTYLYRNPTGDDAWFAEQSYWLNKVGYIRSDFFTGVLDWHKQLLVSHKLFLAVGAGLMRLFGPNLWAVQLTGLLFFVLLIAELLHYVHEQERTWQSLYVMGLLILIFSNRLLIKMSFENRPEMMLAALGFGSFLLLNRERFRAVHVLLAGVLAGMAVLTHLNGVIYAVAGFGMLLYLRQYRNASLFGITAGLVSLIYFADVVAAPNGFTTWYWQFRHDPATQNAFGIGAKLWVMLTYPTLFVQPPEVLALTLLLVYLLIMQRTFWRQLPQKLTVYIVVLLLAFWLITKKNSGLYSLLFAPFMLALCYELYRQRPFWNTGLKVVLGIYAIIGLYGTVEIIYKNISQPYLPTVHARLRSHIPTHAKGLVPLTFFFNDYDHYDRLITYDSYLFRHQPNTGTPAQLAQWAAQQKIGFLVVDSQTNHADYIPSPNSLSVGPYRRTYTDGRFAVFTLAVSPPASASPPGRRGGKRSL
jgi:hypothetical protein